MTVTELYDNLSDEELKEALKGNDYYFNQIGIKHSQITVKTTYDEVIGLLHKQAATRWLKNQSK